MGATWRWRICQRIRFNESTARTTRDRVPPRLQAGLSRWRHTISPSVSPRGIPDSTIIDQAGPPVRVAAALAAIEALERLEERSEAQRAFDAAVLSLAVDTAP